MLRSLLLLALLPTLVLAQKPTREEKVRLDKKAVEAKGDWIYNDFPAAVAEAKKSGKPLLAVLRCIPCEECVKLDDDVLDADKRLKPLLAEFVRVRLVSTNGLDLSLFQFDTDQSWAAFLLNADGTIYGRFGTRSHRKEWTGDVSVDGLAQAMEGALELHKGYPDNKATLASKRGPVPAFRSPELLPTLKGRYTAKLDYAGKVVPSCIHCHQVGEAIRAEAMKKGELADEMLFPYPHPRVVGLTLDPKQRATVLKAEGIAAEAGIEAGDVIETMKGQPLLSIADVQWVLHRAKDKVRAVVRRGDKRSEKELKLAEGWRRKDDISWRASTWELRRLALGGLLLKSDKGGLRVEHVGQYAPHDRANRAGVRKGDLLKTLDGKAFTRETDAIAHGLKDKVRVLEIVRDKKTLKLKLPE